MALHFLIVGLKGKVLGRSPYGLRDMACGSESTRTQSGPANASVIVDVLNFGELPARRLFRAVMSGAVLAVLAFLAAFPAGAELRAGAARVDITPDVKARSIPLGGYAARKGAAATGVHDAVYAHALVLSDGPARAAIVSLDLCFCPASIKAEVLKRLQSRSSGWTAPALFLAATHTHSAPDPLAMHAGNTFALKGWTLFDPDLLAFTADRIASAIVTAEKAARPATAATGATDAAALNRNRRGEALTDPALTLLRIRGTDGKAIAAIVNYAAHPTLYGDDMLRVSADWPGVMAADMEAEMGEGAVCVYLNGAEGDASPNGVDDRRGDDKVAAYGHKVADVAKGLLPSLADERSPALAIWSIDVTLPPRKPNAMFVAAAGQLGATFSQARTLVDTMMPTATTVTMIRIGKLLLIGMPCEPTAELGLKVKAAARAAGFASPAVVALTNDWLAYALMPEQYRKGNYEAMMSFYGDQLGPTLLQSVQQGLRPR